MHLLFSRTGLKQCVIDIAGQIAGNASGSLSGGDAGQSGGTEPHEFSCCFRIVANAIAARLVAGYRTQYLMQAIYHLINVLIRQLQAAAFVSEHCDSIQMARFGAVGCQPDVDDLFRQSCANKASAKGQYIGIVVLATVAGAGEIVGKRRPNIRHLVRDHARTYTSAVNHNADVCAASGNRVRNRTGKQRIVHCFTR